MMRSPERRTAAYRFAALSSASAEERAEPGISRGLVQKRKAELIKSRAPLQRTITLLHVKLRELISRVDMVLAQLRQHYWIIRGREAVKRMARDCEICVRERVKPSHQQMAVYKPPFCHTAVDYFGPMEVGLTETNFTVHQNPCTPIMEPTSSKRN